MMSGHTVGPWFKDEDGQLKNLAGERVEVWGCGLTGVYKSERAIANSRLIEAAPDLLEALQALLERLQLDGEAKAWFPKEQEDAIKAIAKALTP